MRPGHRSVGVVLALGTLLGACTGQISDSSTGPGRPNKPGTTKSGDDGYLPPRADIVDASVKIPTCELSAGPAPARRLTRQEYDNTVRDLLRQDDLPGLAEDASDGRVGVFDGVGIFTSNTAFPISDSGLARQYLLSAQILATRAVAKLATVSPCMPQASGDEPGCAQKFVETFGARAFRRPLVKTEVDRYVALYKAARDGGDSFSGGIKLVVTTLLQSPKFLNHIEVGRSGNGPVVALSSFEVAARLSYMLWGTMPDDALFERARMDALSRTDQVQAQALLMLDDPRARKGIMRFYSQWLELGKVETKTKDAKLFPDFNATLARAMHTESETFVDHVLWDDSGRLGTLLTGSFSFVNEALAKVYGLAGVSGNTLVRKDLDPTQRGGILTHPAFLAANAYSELTDPVHRGKFVRESLLCQHTPPPPDDVQVVIPPANPNQTTRERYEEHLDVALCRGCHLLLNPIGLSMENYDPIGRFRTQENGLPIDAGGEILAPPSEMDESLAGKFDGAVALGKKLAASDSVKDCVARQWLTYALARPEDAAARDACTVDRLGAIFRATGGDLRQLVVAVAVSDAFRYRSSLSSQVCQ